jgi:hypothetical protein
MKRLLPVLVCLLAGKSVFAEAPETPQQELARAEVLERNHKHAEALALARKAAEAGLAEAWYWIGMNTTDADPAAFVKAAGLGYAPAFPFALDGVLFRAGHKADVTQAKHLADLARSRHVNLGYDSAAELQTIDRCFQAGEPNIPTKWETRTSEGESRFALETRLFGVALVEQDGASDDLHDVDTRALAQAFGHLEARLRTFAGQLDLDQLVVEERSRDLGDDRRVGSGLADPHDRRQGMAVGAQQAAQGRGRHERLLAWAGRGRHGRKLPHRTAPVTPD